MKYTKEVLEEVIKNSVSVLEVLRNLGLKQSGGMHFYISNKIKEFDLSTSHFLGKSSNSGTRHKCGKKLSFTEILVLRVNGVRQKAHLLRRALIEFGREYCCDECKIKEWNNKLLFLHVDHIDGNWLDNRPTNLRFLCPNCHSQTANYCGSKGLSDLTTRARSYKKAR